MAGEKHLYPEGIYTGQLQLWARRVSGEDKVTLPWTGPFGLKIRGVGLYCRVRTNCDPYSEICKASNCYPAEFI